MSIAAVEDYLVAQTRALLGTKVRGVATLPGDWDDEMLKRFAQAVPGVLFSFAGGERREAGGGLEASIDARWAAYVCTGHPTEAARRRGDALQVGAYTLVELLAPFLHGLCVPGAGTVRLVSVANLFTGTIERQALTVYALVLSLPLTFEAVPADAVLAPFETFDVQYDIPPITPAEHGAWLAGNYTTSNPDARDTVVLPQP